MKRITEFTKTTIVGGFVVILPVAITAFMIATVVAKLRVVIEPLAASLPGGPIIATLIALGTILAACFVTGTFARTTMGERAWQAFEHGLLERIPGYDLVYRLSRRAFGQDDGTMFAPALAVFDDAMVPAFVVEEHADGRYTVFVPAVPTPAVGAVYIMDRARVHVLDVPFQHAVRCITQWGMGSGELLGAMKGS